MNIPHGFNNCEQIQSYCALYHLPVAALLWCGVPSNQIQDHLKNSTETATRGVLSNPYISCMEPRCRALHEAINNGQLAVCRENGIPVEDHVKPERRYIRSQDLKEWLAKNFPGDKPNFLFDEIERKAHNAINTDAYQALQADRDAARAEIRQITQQLQKLTSERDAFKSCLDKMTEAQSSQNTPGGRSETTYQNIIAALLDCIAGNLPDIVKHPSFSSEAGLIDAIDKHYRGYGGLSKSNLSRKFPEAKQKLRSQ